MMKMNRELEICLIALARAAVEQSYQDKTPIHDTLYNILDNYREMFISELFAIGGCDLIDLIDVFANHQSSIENDKMISKAIAELKPHTQLECYRHMVNGGTLLQGDLKIKFVDGRLSAIKNNGECDPCPIIFENPSLFRYGDG